MIPRHLIGELQRGERFEQREQRPAEQAGLLAGEDGDRAWIGKTPRSVDRRWRRVPVSLLRDDDVRDFAAAMIVRLRAGDCAGPRGALGWIARKKRRDRAEIVRVVGGEPANPRKAPDIDGNADGRLGGRGAG